jgi:hypothetical protein
MVRLTVARARLLGKGVADRGDALVTVRLVQECWLDLLEESVMGSSAIDRAIKELPS